MSCLPEGCSSRRGKRSPIAAIAKHTALAQNHFWVEHDFVTRGPIVLNDELTVNIPTAGKVKLKTEPGYEPAIKEDKDRRTYSCKQSKLKRDSDEDEKEKVLDMTIEELDLTVRSFNCLKRAGINTVSELVQHSEEDMMKVRNLGRKSLTEVQQKLAALGHSLKKDEE